jgi:nitrogen fixation NifU-like protein
MHNILTKVPGYNDAVDAVKKSKYPILLSGLAEGKTLLDAMEITNEVVEKALGGLPPEKRHCSNMAADALYEAMQDYLYRRAVEGKVSPARCSGDSWRTMYLPREVPGSKRGRS